ncbi:MAG TPA: hypothetical protein VGM56_10350 [Byssovorax sp.]
MLPPSLERSGDREVTLFDEATEFNQRSRWEIPARSLKTELYAYEVTWALKARLAATFNTSSD